MAKKYLQHVFYSLCIVISFFIIGYTASYNAANANSPETTSRTYYISEVGICPTTSKPTTPYVILPENYSSVLNTLPIHSQLCQGNIYTTPYDAIFYRRGPDGSILKMNGAHLTFQACHDMFNLMLPTFISIAKEKNITISPDFLIIGVCHRTVVDYNAEEQRDLADEAETKRLRQRNERNV